MAGPSRSRRAAELAQLLDGTDRSARSNSVHPGVQIQPGFPDTDSRFAKTLSVMPGVTTVVDGGAELLFPAVSPQTADISGRYFRDQQPTTPSRTARDTDAARRLWSYSAGVLDIEEPLVVAAS